MSFSLVNPLCLNGVNRLTTRGPGSKLMGLLMLAGLLHCPLTRADPHRDVQLLLRQGNVNGALVKITEYLTDRPRDPQMRLWQANLELQQGNTNVAMAQLTALTQEFPELAEPHNNLGVLYAAQNNIDLAQQSFEWALRANPNMGAAHENLADVLVRQAQRHYLQTQQLDRANTTVVGKLKQLDPLLRTTSDKP